MAFDNTIELRGTPWQKHMEIERTGWEKVEQADIALRLRALAQHEKPFQHKVLQYFSRKEEHGFFKKPQSYSLPRKIRY